MSMPIVPVERALPETAEAAAEVLIFEHWEYIKPYLAGQTPIPILPAGPILNEMEEQIASYEAIHSMTSDEMAYLFDANQIPTTEEITAWYAIYQGALLLREKTLMTGIR